MPLHPDVKAKLEALAALNLPDLLQLSSAQARGQSLSLAASLPPPEGIITIHSEDYYTKPSHILLRRYIPEEPSDTTLVYYHGGGYVLCSVEQYDRFCRLLTKLTGFNVISVDYRLAPEHAFPGFVHDCYEALCWIDEHRVQLGLGHTKKLIVGGDSAGGHAAAMMAILARDRHGPQIDFQWLIYPWVDDDVTRQSYVDYGEGYWLTLGRMEWFLKHVFSKGRQANFQAMPLQAEDLSHLPPAYVVVAECDVLYSEGLAYAEKLTAAATNVTVECAEGMIHGFITDYITPAAALVSQRCIKHLLNMLLSCRKSKKTEDGTCL